MTIFDYLKDIVCDKKGNLSLEQYSPYLVNRWLSFINPLAVLAINEVNSQTLLEDKEIHYRAMVCMFPKLKYMPRINYIKKVKENEETENSNKLLAESNELSQREIEAMMQF